MASGEAGRLAWLSEPDEALRTRARQALDQAPCLQVELDGHRVPGHGFFLEQRGRYTPFDLPGKARPGFRAGMESRIAARTASYLALDILVP